MQPVVVLLHSPLVGPLTWAPVSRELRQRSIDTVLPVLMDQSSSDVPYWVQHAAAVARRLEPLPPDTGLILVGHSGAGPLLPAIGAFSSHPIAGYIFVDASLPHPGQSHLQDLEADDPDFGADVRNDLEAGGSFPQWTDEDLREIIPDEGLRRGILAELHPRNLAFFKVPLPHCENWPDAPCAYVRFSEAYDQPAEQARERSWPYRGFDAGHFHMLEDAVAVTEAMFQLMASILCRRTASPTISSTVSCGSTGERVDTLAIADSPLLGQPADKEQALLR